MKSSDLHIPRWVATVVVAGGADRRRSSRNRIQKLVGP